jgi:pimeloyl-ACP methyl ester carboxylesterase
VIVLVEPVITAAAGRPSREVPRTVLRLSGGRTLAYAEAGSGPPLIAIHGTLMTLEDMWLGPVPALSEHFRVIAVDRPGHGASARQRMIDASPWRQAEILHEGAAALGLERPVVLGHSFGGAVALAYAMQFPDAVAGCVALAPVCFPEVRLEQMLFGPRGLPLIGEGLSAAANASSDRALLPLLWNAMFLPEVMPARFAAAFPFDLAGNSAQMLCEGEDAAGLTPALLRSAWCYPTCRVPVRILGGTADIVVNNLAHGAPAAALMPQARFEAMPGAGHMLHHTRTSAVVRAARAILAP